MTTNSNTVPDAVETILLDLEERVDSIRNLQPFERYELRQTLKTAAHAVKPVSTSGDQVEGKATANETVTADKRVRVEGLTAGETAPLLDAPPPERTWHSGALQIAMQAGSWFDRKDLTLSEREMAVAQIISDFAESVARADIAARSEALSQHSKAIAEEIDALFDAALQGGRLYSMGFNRDEILRRLAGIVTPAARSEGEAVIDYKKYATDYEKEFSSWIGNGSKVYNLGDCAIFIWHNIIEPLRARVKQLEASASAPATEVERALIELNETFPNAYCRIKAEQGGHIRGDGSQIETAATAKIYVQLQDGDEHFEGATLTEAMAAVLEWRAKKES